MPTRKYIFFTTLAGALMIIPASSIIWCRPIPSFLVYAVLFCVLNLASLAIYIFILKDFTSGKKLALSIAVVSLAFAILMAIATENLLTKNTAGWGAMGTMYLAVGALVIYLVDALVLFFMYAKKCLAFTMSIIVVGMVISIILWKMIYINFIR